MLKQRYADSSPIRLARSSATGTNEDQAGYGNKAFVMGLGKTFENVPVTQGNGFNSSSKAETLAFHSGGETRPS